MRSDSPAGLDPLEGERVQAPGAVYLTIYNNLDGGHHVACGKRHRRDGGGSGKDLELLGYISELKKGKPLLKGTYPAAQTKEQLDAALKGGKARTHGSGRLSGQTAK